MPKKYFYGKLIAFPLLQDGSLDSISDPDSQLKKVCSYVPSALISAKHILVTSLMGHLLQKTLYPTLDRVLWLERLKATYVTLIAVVGRLVFDPTLIGNLLACSNQLVS